MTERMDETEEQIIDKEVEILDETADFLCTSRKDIRRSNLFGKDGIRLEQEMHDMRLYNDCVATNSQFCKNKYVTV